MQRRDIFKLGAAAAATGLPSFAIAQPAQNRVLKMVPQANLTSLDPVTGAAYRQFSHVTQTEKSRLTVEFEDNVVTTVEESEDKKEGNVRIVVPPLIFGW